MKTQANDPVDAILTAGLKDLWYPICPSNFVAERPVSLRRHLRGLAKAQIAATEDKPA